MHPTIWLVMFLPLKERRGNSDLFYIRSCIGGMMISCSRVGPEPVSFFTWKRFNGFWTRKHSFDLRDIRAWAKTEIHYFLEGLFRLVRCKSLAQVVWGTYDGWFPFFPNPSPCPACQIFPRDAALPRAIKKHAVFSGRCIIGRPHVVV